MAAEEGISAASKLAAANATDAAAATGAAVFPWPGLEVGAGAGVAASADPPRPLGGGGPADAASDRLAAEEWPERIGPNASASSILDGGNPKMDVGTTTDRRYDSAACADVDLLAGAEVGGDPDKKGVLQGGSVPAGCAGDDDDADGPAPPDAGRVPPRSRSDDCDDRRHGRATTTFALDAVRGLAGAASLGSSPDPALVDCPLPWVPDDEAGAADARGAELLSGSPLGVSARLRELDACAGSNADDDDAPGAGRASRSVTALAPADVTASRALDSGSGLDDDADDDVGGGERMAGASGIGRTVVAPAGARVVAVNVVGGDFAAATGVGEVTMAGDDAPDAPDVRRCCSCCS